MIAGRCMICGAVVDVEVVSGARGKDDATAVEGIKVVGGCEHAKQNGAPVQMRIVNSVPRWAEA